MEKKDFFIGFIIGIFAAILGAFIFLKLFTHYNLFLDYKQLSNAQLLGKVITLGAILNIIVFFILLKFKKEFMSRGVILATIILAILTLFL
jgi:hypothetical protein